MFCSLQSTVRISLAALLLTFCSCQGLSRSPSSRLEQNLQSATPRPPELFLDQATKAAPIIESAEDPSQPTKPRIGPNNTRLEREYNPPAKPVEIPRLARGPQGTALPPIPGTPAPAVRPPNLTLNGPPEGYQQLAARPRGHAGHDGNCRSCPPGDCPAFQFETDAPQGQFVPPGIGRPWPYDEYIWNGCDKNEDVRVKRDWSVIGLDPQDTIAHYDTLDGRTEVARANCVPIYAPRFAAARKVTEVITYHGQDLPVAAMQPERVVEQLEKRIATTAVQPVQPIDDGSYRGLEIFRERNQGIMVEEARLPYLAQRDFLPHEDLLIIQRGVFHADEKARLAQRAEAAIVWSHDKAVQVIVDGDLPAELNNAKQVQGIHVFDRNGKPCLRIIKIASKSEALPGEIVDFTLRFDNIGNETIGNVTIIDNLVSRLEFVEGSDFCSIPATFVPKINDEESLTLRWEVRDPLKTMQGGIIRFQCRVR